MDKKGWDAEWIQAGSFTFEDVANYSNTLLSQVADFKVVNIRFSQSTSGLRQLFIRIRVANKNVGATTAATGGTLTATINCQLGHLSITYNK